MFGTLIRIAMRNLLAHKLKSFIVGGILVFGTMLVLLGAALLGSIEASMAESITGSVSGHLQLASSKGKDQLVLFPGPLDGNEIGVIEDFPKVRARLEALPEVRAVLPQGFDYAMIFAANLIDRKLANMRTLRGKGELETYRPVRDHVRRIVELLDRDIQRIRGVIDLDKDDGARRGAEDVHHAAQPEFWADFEENFAKRMEFLENKVAQMAIGEDILFIRYMGTDIARFTSTFNRFEMVRGEPIPPGQRGVVLNTLYHEEMLKQKTARRLDKMKDKIAEGARFESDDELREWRRMNVTQYKEISWQLDDAAADRVAEKLRAHLGPAPVEAAEAASPTDDASGPAHAVDGLLRRFLDMDDGNFAARYQLFYDVIAKELQLYRVDVGDTLTIRGMSQGGYMSSVNVKVYGTFRFQGLDKSALGGMVNLMDIVSYRDLYGFVTAEQKAEIKALEKRSGLQEIAAENAEDALFGEDADLAAEASATGFDEFADVDMSKGAAKWNERLTDIVYTQAQIDGGVVRNAAVVLNDPKQLQAARIAIERIAAEEKLPIKVLDWKQASGMLGNFVSVIYAVLLVAILGVFGVALLIINNSMVLSTMERTKEIGTIRAIGGSRRFVLWMFLIESIVLGAVFGAIGVGLGAGIVGWLGNVGIPATNDTLVFLFGGPRMYPWLSGAHVAFALGLVVMVTTISTIYPALLATRVTPLEAMQDKEG
ncbi:MAG: ABC transporter permease [Deltaproteobacteria bacterium]|nr:ABC transporter permease [Deltaproteobacteria bacterium]